VFAALAPPKPLGSALLMRRPWALLLRLVLQLGLSQVDLWAGQQGSCFASAAASRGDDAAPIFPIFSWQLSALSAAPPPCVPCCPHPQESILYLSSPSTEEDDEVAAELARLLPRWGGGAQG
jgi:hypothetical protein